MTSPGAAPRVTVITPAYNRASYLDETIASVLAQDYPDIEYIVIDDGSTDDSLRVIEKYRGRVRVETQANMGETRTVNRGFSLATGAIVGIVNSDDPLLPGAVRRAVEAFQRDPALLVAYPDWEMIDGEGKVVQRIRTFDYDYLDMLRRHHCVPGPGAFFRREVVERLGGRDPQFRYVGDFDFWLRAGLLGPFARIPETLATFRLHPDSASVSDRGAAMAEEHIRLVRKIYAMPGLPDAVRRLRREAYGSASYIAGCVCGEGRKGLRLLYFLRALLASPSRYRDAYRDRLPVIESAARQAVSAAAGAALAPARALARALFR